MSNSVYPAPFRGLTYTTVKAASSSTIVQSSPSKREVRIAQSQNPVWTWQLIYEVLFGDLARSTASFSPYSDLQELMGFFLARQGMFDDFLYNDVDDNAVAAQAMQLVNDGAGTYYTPLQRNMGGQFFEDITDLNPLNGSGLTVKANGVSQTIGTCGGGANCELHGPGLAIPGYSFGGMYLKWCAAPTAPITASFSFYFRVRFASDKQDFEKFVNGLWTIGGSEGKSGSGMIKLVTARPATA